MSGRIRVSKKGGKVSKRDSFDISGPLYLTSVDWKNAHHRRAVAACLVQAVYVLERDRQKKAQGDDTLAPPWWEFCHFQLSRTLVDATDSSIFGAIFEFKPHFCSHNDMYDAPQHVIAFRGTITKGDCASQDLRLDLHVIKNGLHVTPRFELAMQAVRGVVAASEGSNIWLTGHSLGSAIAMLAGKNMARTGIYLEAFLFNPPFLSAPIGRIKDEKVRHGIRIAGSLITAGLALAKKGNHQRQRSESPFNMLSAWLPSLFVHPSDHICSEYIGYFEHRKKMEDIGAGAIERLASQNSLTNLMFSNTNGNQAEPLHLLPSATLTTNLTPAANFKEAHGIQQWWMADLNLHAKLYRY